PVVESAEPRDSRSASPPADDFSFDTFFAEKPPAPPPDPVARDRERVPEPPAVVPAPTPPLDPDPAPAAAPAEPPAVVPSDAALHAAFLRGLGLHSENLATEATAAEMEALGQRFRLLTEGLVQLLRTRTKEKSSVRVAQTVIGSAEVNPLKFLATTDEALAALIAPRGRGYLAPDAAITAAFQDLNDHQMRTWAALQTALRQMIDRFDPAQFETEVDAAGLTKTLLAGGRNARLWQLYSERYREIAISAEDRFLGAVGADFRDAYEGNRRTKND
ncbi:MAG: type VI secretion system-associated FHA domain protein TagH, partial [Paracoccaceae bacterium]|nr:type VI secretion system-associated FHA domain protein TagH [Paracoccaceae bacterium]